MDEDEKNWEYTIHIPVDGTIDEGGGIYSIMNAIELHTPDCPCDKCQARRERSEGDG